MTPDEVVRAIHRLEAEVGRIRNNLMLAASRETMLEKKFDRLLAQQNALLGAIRGLEVTPVPQ